MRSPEQNLEGVMAYLRQAEPKRERFEKVTQQDIQAMLHRLDEAERRIEELNQRLEELTP